MSDRKRIAIRVPRVSPEESGPRDAESRAVGQHPAFRRLVEESRRRRAAGEHGLSIDDALAEAEAEERSAAATRRPVRTASLSAMWLGLLAEYVDQELAEGDRRVASVSDIADLPITALRGVSREDAEAIQKAFGVSTIRQLAEHRLVRAAQALTLLVDQQAS